MHLCLITPSFPPLVDGGVAISTGRLVDRLLAAGHRVTVLTTPPPNHTDHASRFQTLGQGRFSLHYRLMDDPLHAPLAVADLYRWAEAAHHRQPFEVLLAYFIYPSGYLATLLGEHLRLPVVCSCRGNDISKEMFIDPHTIATVLHRSTRLIFVSTSLLRMADTLVPCRAKATVVANAVDSTMFVPAPEADGPPQRTVILGTSGLLRWKKGIDVFLPLLRALCASCDLQVLIAGYPLDTTVEQQLTHFLSRHGLGKRVEITGPVPHHQMVHLLQRMHLFVSPSYQEGMPNSVLEAMACALPVVATDADGTAELVEDGVTGYLCDRGDLEALIRRCRDLIDHPHRRRRMGRAGRHRVRHHFHPHREVAAIVAILQHARSCSP